MQGQRGFMDSPLNGDQFGDAVDKFVAHYPEMAEIRDLCATNIDDVLGALLNMPEIKPGMINFWWQCLVKAYADAGAAVDEPKSGASAIKY
eukprot:7801690-Pyramimonas_sp.AAC.1